MVYLIIVKTIENVCNGCWKTWYVSKYFGIQTMAYLLLVGEGQEREYFGLFANKNEEETIDNQATVYTYWIWCTPCRKRELRCQCISSICKDTIRHFQKQHLIRIIYFIYKMIFRSIVNLLSLSITKGITM